MPKMKSKSGARKRFRFTGTGKLKRAKTNHNHCLSTKNAKRGRRLRMMALVDSTNAAQVERLFVG